MFFETAFLDELMTVGWGKKETQFQGSAGKQAAAEVTEVRFFSKSMLDLLLTAY